MYIGNGVTKKFPLPNGYDGSIVILKMAGGSGIRMAQDVSYTVEDNAVQFFTAPPAGIEINFDESDASEVMDKNSGAYIIIYADGSIKEVDEDPSLILEEARKILTEAKEMNSEANENLVGAKEYIKGVFTTSGADLDGRLDGYAQQAKELATSAAYETRKIIESDWEILTKRLNIQEINLTDKLEKINNAVNDADNLKTSFISEIQQEAELASEKANKYLKDFQQIKLDVQAEADNAKLKINEVLQTAISEIRTKFSGEFEMLKSLRLRAV